MVFARALSTSPKIFLLDEPTRGIDVGSKMEIYQLLKNLSGQGAGILLISSELPELIALCHRIIVMRYGKITGEFSKGEVSEEKILNCAFMDQEGAVAYGYNI